MCWDWLESAEKEEAFMANFEEHLTQLETVVERLERGDLTLERIAAPLRGRHEALQRMQKELEQAEGRIQVLVEGKGGTMKPADLEMDKAEGGGMDAEEADEEV